MGYFIIFSFFDQKSNVISIFGKISQYKFRGAWYIAIHPICYILIFYDKLNKSSIQIKTYIFITKINFLINIFFSIL